MTKGNTVTTTTSPIRRRVQSISYARVGAAIAAFFSWLTTYWCLAWILSPDSDKAILVIVSVALEILLMCIKGLLFDASRRNDMLGWGGFIVDSLINAGGIIPGAGRLLTWPPIAALLSIANLDTTSAASNTVGALVIALVGGALLSVAPHRLWRAGGGTQED